MYVEDAEHRRDNERREAITQKVILLLEQRDAAHEAIRQAEREIDKAHKRIARINATIERVRQEDQDTIARLLRGEQQQEQKEQQ